MELKQIMNGNKAHINYFDFGLYNAIELRWMKCILPLFTDKYNLYGFEACKSHYDKLTSLEDKNTKLFNVAISNSPEDVVKLYHADNRIGHSIYASKNNVSSDYEKVKSIRFSKWLLDEKINLDNSFNIIKINIEGAEWDFFNDLIENNLHKKINTFYASYDKDIKKIKQFLETGIEAKYDKLLKDNGITPQLY